MTSLHEMAAMNEAMNNVGDTPPTKEQVQDSIKESAPPTEEVSTEQQEPTEDLSGGLVGMQEEETSPPVSINDILGITEDQAKPVGEEKTVAPTTKEEPADSNAGGSDSALLERVRELSESNKQLQETNTLLTKNMLAGNESGGEQTAIEPELDGDMVDYFAPYTRKATAESNQKIKDIQDAIAPMIKQQQDAAIAVEIAKHVPGFDVKDFSKMESAYQSASEAEQGLYKGSIAGAIILAQKLSKEGSFGQSKPKKQSNALARQHMTEHGGSAAEHASEIGDEEKAKRIMDLSPDKVLDILQKLENGG